MSFAKALEKVQGQKLEGDIPSFSAKTIGSAVIGMVAGFASYNTKETATEKSRPVRYVKLKSAIEYDAGENLTLQHIAIKVDLNHDLKSKIDDQTMEAGTILLIEHTDVAVEFNNMRRYRVEILTKAQYNELLRADSEHAAAR